MVIEPEAQLEVPRGIAHVTIDLVKPEVPIETPTDFVSLKYVKLEVGTAFKRAAQKCPSDPTALEVGMHEQPSYLVTNHGHESNYPAFMFGHGYIRDRHPVVRDLDPFGLEELVTKKRVCDSRGLVPSVKYLWEIRLHVGAEHYVETIPGETVWTGAAELRPVSERQHREQVGSTQKTRP